MAARTPEEIQLCQMLRDKVKDILEDEYSKSDVYLVRWIRINDGNLDKAATMIRAAAKWYKDNKLMDILKNPVNPFFPTNFPLTIGGQDKIKRPLVTIPFGKWDLSKALSDETRYEQFKIYALQTCEQLMAEIKRADTQRNPVDLTVTQFVSIYDFNGFAFTPLMNLKVSKHLAQLVGLFEANYPETLGSCIFINCPTAITTFLTIIRPVMYARTFSKIKWFGTNRTEWQPAILSIVDASQLTPQYGGTKAA